MAEQEAKPTQEKLDFFGSILAELEAGRPPLLKVYIPDNEDRLVYQGDMAADGFTEERLRKKFGAGRFVVMARSNDNKRLVSRIELYLSKVREPQADSAGEASGAEPGGPALDKLTALLSSLNSRLEALERRPEEPRHVIRQDGGISDRELILKLMERQMTPAAPASSPLLSEAVFLKLLDRGPSSDLEGLIRVHKLMKGELDESEPDPMNELVKNLTPLVMASIVKMGQKESPTAHMIPVKRLPQRAPAAPAQPVPPSPAAMKAAPASTEEGDDMTNPLVTAAIRANASALLNLAQTMTPEEGAAYLVQVLPPMAYDLLEREDWLEVFQAAAPSLKECSTWLEAVRPLLLEAVTAPEESEK